MTAVVERAEKAGKHVKPLIVPTNNPLHAVLKTAQDLHSQEAEIGASNKFTAEEQLDQISLYWISLHDGKPPPRTVRILNRNRDIHFDLEGGNRIPKIGERQLRSVAELRAAGVGVNRVLFVHDGTPASSDLFLWVLTVLDPQVVFDLFSIPAAEPHAAAADVLDHDCQQAQRLGLNLAVHVPQNDVSARPRSRGQRRPLRTDYRGIACRPITYFTLARLDRRRSGQRPLSRVPGPRSR